MKTTEHNARSAATAKTGLLAKLCAFLEVDGSGAPSRTRAALVIPALVVMATAFVASPAFGASGASYVLRGSFPTAAGESGVAVNVTSGDVYVTVSEGVGVQVFNAEGDYLSHFPVEHGAGDIVVDNGNPLTDPSAGDLYVISTKEAKSGKEVQEGVIDKFEADGTYLGQITEGPPGTTFSGGVSSIAVEPSGVLWVDANGELLTYNDAVKNEFRSVESVEYAGLKGAVDPTNNDVYISEHASNQVSSVSLFSSGGTLIENFGSEDLGYLGGSVAVNYNLAATPAYVTYGDYGFGSVDIFKDLDVPTVTTGAVSELSAGSATLNGKLNPEGEPVSSCEFEYGTSTAYGKTAACVHPDAAELGSGSTEVAVHAKLSGLPLGEYHYRLVASNTANGEGPRGQDQSFQAGPVISGEALSEVGSLVATVSAQINPEGVPTTYRFEYGTSVAYGSSTPEASIGAGTENVGVSTRLTGLQPDTLYHVRVVATDAFGTAFGNDLTTVTFAPSTAVLPDSRAYELVSHFPFGTDQEAYVPAIDGAYIQEEAHGVKTPLPFRVAANGEAVAYAGDPSPTGGYGNRGEGTGNEYMARHTSNGWESANVQPLDVNATYEAFSSDLAVGIVGSSESELGGESEAYRDLYSHPTAAGAAGEYDPLYAGAPPYRSTADFGLYENDYAGANAGTSTVPAFSHLLFAANDALTENALGGSGKDPSTNLPFAEEYNLYDSIDGRLYLVNVLPDGGTDANASFAQPQNHNVPTGGSNPISADGSRIFWTTLEGSGRGAIDQGGVAKALYARENDTQPQSPLGGVTGEECTVSTDACTVQLDASQGGSESGGGLFWAASSDGSRVFFTDCRKLTADSTAVFASRCEEREESAEHKTPTGQDLYEYDFDKPLGERLTDLTVEEGEHAGEAADVQGLVGASENGEYVYFAADGVLTAGENSEGKAPVSGQPNMYLRHGGATTFIATLSATDGDAVPPLTNGCEAGNAVGCMGDWQAAGGYRTAQVTPDGQSLVFMSKQELTGYDSRQSGTGDVLDEVFLYEASSGALRCVSCNPTGEPPVPTEVAGPHFPFGAYIPTSRSVAGEQPRVISEDGSRVFFNSAEPLSPTDTSGWMGVYEWERSGAPGGSCPEGAPGGGCVYLLSSGTSPENSYLIGTDASGDNAFFVSRAQLVPEDAGNDGDVVYDARVDGFQPPAAAACEGTGCQGVPPTPPIFATPSSVTFNGVGNFSPAAPPAPPKKTTKKTVKCKKGFTKKKNKCVKTKAKKKKAKKASNKRRASR